MLHNYPHFDLRFIFPGTHWHAFKKKIVVQPIPEKYRKCSVSSFVNIPIQSHCQECGHGFIRREICEAVESKAYLHSHSRIPPYC